MQSQNEIYIREDISTAFRDRGAFLDGEAVTEFAFLGDSGVCSSESY